MAVTPPPYPAPGGATPRGDPARNPGRSNTKPPWPRLSPTPRAEMHTQTAHAVARHRRDQGACRDGQQIDLAEAHAGAQGADDGIAAVQGARQRALVASIALDHVTPGRFALAFERTRATTEWPLATASRTIRRPVPPVAPKTKTFMFDLDLS